MNMSSSSLHKVKNGCSNEFSWDVCDDENSARTRPLSFDEVMRRRKNKKEVVENSICPEGADKVSVKDVEEVSEHFELRKNSNHDTDPSRSHPLEDSLRESSRKKETASTRERKLGRNTDKESRKRETSPDATRNKNVSSDRNVERSSDRRDQKSTDELRKERVKRHQEDSVQKDRSGGKSRGKGEERKSSYQAADNDRLFRSKRKKDDMLSNDSENRSKKRDSRELTGAEKHLDRNRGKTEKDTKRKHHIENEERLRDRYEIRKHDSGRKENSDFPERKETESTIHHEESKLRRRRSRSREREQDRVRRSSSPKVQKHRRSSSPKVQKHSSYDVQEHRDSATNSSKNRSGVLHSDTDRRRMSSNGASGHYRRHGGSSSGLGGYSPRKRKSEAAARTPSPVKRSPETRSAGWDLPPGKRSNGAGGPASYLQSSSQNVSLSTQESPAVIPVMATSKPIEIPYNFALSKISAVDTIQLTQATRPMRRLYIENLPASASEKAVMEWMNTSLSSSGANYIRGTQPCISCMIHKEKGQALLEFLTPEDASAALFFDGRTFCGSILKFRRPKDFTDVTTGVAEKSLASGDSVGDFIEDSPHKIVVAGISEVISPEMLMEVARAFGPLKAYQFEVNTDLKEPCAFLEYVDHSVTLKACAGLNGVKLGGQVLTVVQAIPEDSGVVNVENQAYYGIPEHAKPLLQKPTQVLELKNMLDPERFLSLSEAEMDEILEDVRLECSRFGTVKSINLVKPRNCSSTMETLRIMVSNASVDGVEFNDSGKRCVSEAEIDDIESGEAGRSEPRDDGGRSSVREAEINVIESGVAGEPPQDGGRSSVKEAETIDIEAGRSVSPSCGKETKEDDKSNEVSRFNNECIPDSLNNSADPEGVSKHGICEGHAVDCLEELSGPNRDDRTSEMKGLTQELSPAISGEYSNHVTSENRDESASITLEEHEMKKLSSNEEDFRTEENSGKLDGDSHLKSLKEKGLGTSEEEGADVEMVSNSTEISEPGCVLVEFKREEAACRAAHCLHRRLFDNRIVTVRYIDPEAYRRRYVK